MTTNAKIGYGVLFKIADDNSPANYNVVGEQTNVTPPKISGDTHDATHNESPNAAREYIPGLVDGGEVSIEINYVPNSAGITTFMNLLRQVATCRIEFPLFAGQSVKPKWDFDAILTGFEPSAPVDDKMTATVTFKVTGLPVFTAGS